MLRLLLVQWYVNYDNILFCLMSIYILDYLHKLVVLCNFIKILMQTHVYTQTCNTLIIHCTSNPPRSWVLVALLRALIKHITGSCCLFVNMHPSELSYTSMPFAQIRFFPSHTWTNTSLISQTKCMLTCFLYTISHLTYIKIINSLWRYGKLEINVYWTWF